MVDSCSVTKRMTRSAVSSWRLGGSRLAGDLQRHPLWKRRDHLDAVVPVGLGQRRLCHRDDLAVIEWAGKHREDVGGHRRHELDVRDRAGQRDHAGARRQRARTLEQRQIVADRGRRGRDDQIRGPRGELLQHVQLAVAELDVVRLAVQAARQFGVQPGVGSHDQQSSHRVRLS